jgi:murein DD-endopeptidase MepM/ murein hydrolase activator NlpD
LNANFGEMRPNHFHMGLDLFTERGENLRILAAADGYVARVKIEPGGFGRAIYLNHPNGLTTLYAHMNDFMPELESWLREKQYQSESWAQDLEVPVGKFPVKKGTFIGYSGNTGGSMGPHVHFEIRDTKTEKCLNPLLFGFAIPDKVPPVLKRIALYDRRQSVYQQTPLMLSLMPRGGSYSVSGTVRVQTDRVVLAIQATDAMSGVPNANGIYEVRVYDGKKKLGGFAIDRIGYDETRYMNAHIDYATKLAGGAYLQFLFPLEGDQLGIYAEGREPGAILLEDTVVHQIRVEVRDPQGNLSVASLNLQRKGTPVPVRPLTFPVMKAGEVNVFENEQLQLMVPENGLYDSISFQYAARPNPIANAYSPQFSLHKFTVPVHAPYVVRIKADKSIPYPLRDRMLILQTVKDDQEVRKAQWELGWHTARFREFGTVQLVADDQPPVIDTYGLTEGANIRSFTKITVAVRDNYPAIKNFRAELDGKWLMFSQRGKTFTYKMDERMNPGPHTLVLSVDDEAGNRTQKTIRFTR